MILADAKHDLDSRKNNLVYNEIDIENPSLNPHEMALGV